MRYEVTHEGPGGRLIENITDSQTRRIGRCSFPPATGGTVYIDNEVITFTGITEIL